VIEVMRACSLVGEDGSCRFLQNSNTYKVHNAITQKIMVIIFILMKYYNLISKVVVS
jgi:hypothetical protein